MMSAERFLATGSAGARASTVLLRLVFAAIFGVSGFLLGSELYLHAISIHVASELWSIVLHIVVPILGAILGVLIVPAAQRLFEAELSAVERAIDGLAPGEVVYGAIGLTA